MIAGGVGVTLSSTVVGRTPSPSRITVCEEGEASSVMVIWALRTPKVAGVNLTSIRQRCPAGISTLVAGGAGVQPSISVNSPATPDMPMLEMVRSVAPSLVRTKILGELVVFTACPPNTNEELERQTLGPLSTGVIMVSVADCESATYTLQE